MSAPREPLALVILRSRVVLPSQVAKLEISRPENVLALESAGELVAATPLRRARLVVRPSNLADVTTVCRVLSRVRLPGGGLRVTLQGLYRAPLGEVAERDGVLEARPGAPLASSSFEPKELVAAADLLLDVVPRLTDDDPAPELDVLALNAAEPWKLIDLARAAAGERFDRDVALLCEDDPVARVVKLTNDLAGVVEPAGHALDWTPRWRSGRVPLGDADAQELEIRSFEDRIALSSMSPSAREEAQRELTHFRRCRPGSSEAGQIRDWLEWVLEVPWEFDEEPPAVDFETVGEVLGESHRGLRDVKDRVVEHLAVRLLARRAHGTVLCFLGPPGTGKSSMGRAVAEALGRPFAQIPGGTVTEEEQLRGNPLRSGMGSPGFVMQSIRRAGRIDPVILIDEIDKLELGGSGTSGGALLDILDSESNAEFLDHYLGVPYDLSRCIFIVTANDRDEIAESVLDRLEIIEFSGYTEQEKLSIARDHLLPKARSSHGLDKGELRVTPACMRALIRSHTEEAGVRHLQRLLNSLARKAAVDVVRGGEGLVVKKGDLLRLVGPALVEEDIRPQRPRLGVATGLAWTSAGGSLLPVEALAMPGSGRTILTGLLGEALRESVQTALSYVRTRFGTLGIQHDVLDSLDLHLHFPSGGTPKDGPSAGIAIAAALISLLGRVPVRHDVAMTGELSLHGNVLAVGGLKEKLLAAVRAGIREVVVPERNREEALRLPAEVRDHLVIHLVGHVQEAFERTLAQPLKPMTPRSSGSQPQRRRRIAKGTRNSRRRRRRGS